MNRPIDPREHDEIYSELEKTEKRFLSKVEKTDGCWNWKGCVLKNGYGQFYLNKKLVYPHRFSYEFLIGPIKEGLTIDHLCRNTKCVNPKHLETVTQSENNRRARPYHAHSFDHLKRPVIAYKDGKEFARYESASDAARELGLKNSGSIGCAISRPTKTKGFIRKAKGFEWKYGK